MIPVKRSLILKDSAHCYVIADKDVIQFIQDRNLSSDRIFELARLLKAKKQQSGIYTAIEFNQMLPEFKYAYIRLAFMEGIYVIDTVRTGKITDHADYDIDYRIARKQVYNVKPEDEEVFGIYDESELIPDMSFTSQNRFNYDKTHPFRIAVNFIVDTIMVLLSRLAIR